MKVNRWIIPFLGFSYDLVMFPIIVCFIPVSVLFKKTRIYVKSRISIIKFYASIKTIKKDSVVFYCSSIGEFEQAIPLIERFVKGKKEVLIFFHSQNGFDYCKRTTNYTAFLTPFDLFCIWFLILNKIKPSLFIINRHEFWPGAALSASYHSELFIINYIAKNKKNLIDEFAIHFSKNIFSVNELSNKKFFHSGDTRLDRLKDKYHLNEEDILNVKMKIRKHILPDEKLIVIGNCYDEDLKMLLSIKDTSLRFYRFLVVPEKNGIDPKLLRHVKEIKTLENFNWQEDKIIIFNTVGNLFEIYGSADVAWVGGGFTKGVHNCLEPNHYNIPIISGPNLNGQPDALFLEKRKSLHIFENTKGLEGILLKNKLQNDNSLISYKTGSPTDFIYTILNENNYSG